MTKTEYLFGHPKEEYEPLLTMLVKQRLRDARDVLKEIAIQRQKINTQEEMDALILRYKKVEEAINTWEKIAEMEED